MNARRWKGRRRREISASRSPSSVSARPERGRLEEAVAAYREALKERTRERAPLRMGDDAGRSRHRARQARRARERARTR